MKTKSRSHFTAASIVARCQPNSPSEDFLNANNKSKPCISAYVIHKIQSLLRVYIEPLAWQPITLIILHFPGESAVLFLAHYLQPYFLLICKVKFEYWCTFAVGLVTNAGIWSSSGRTCFVPSAKASQQCHHFMKTLCHLQVISGTPQLTVHWVQQITSFATV